MISSQNKRAKTGDFCQKWPESAYFRDDFYIEMFLYSTAEKGNNCIIHRKISISREFPLFPRHSKPEAALFRKAEKNGYRVVSM